MRINRSYNWARQLKYGDDFIGVKGNVFALFDGYLLTIWLHVVGANKEPDPTARNFQEASTALPLMNPTALEGLWHIV